jgi:hypothetical protein
MERFSWFYYEILKQTANVKAVILSVLRKLPLLGKLPDQTLEWIFIALVFIIAVVVSYPLFKWSAKIAIAAAVIAGVIAFITSMSFWGLLPFTGLGVAIVLFSNKFQME